MNETGSRIRVWRPGELSPRTGDVGASIRRMLRGLAVPSAVKDAPDGPAPMELVDVWRGYPSGEGHVEVLKGADLRLEVGQVIIIAGPSGSGKSTLLSLMGCLLRADRGEVRIFGRDVGALAESDVQEIRRRDLGFIFQHICLMAALSAEENVRIAQDLKSTDSPNRHSVHELLDLVGMDAFADRKPAQLSGGQCQRVAVARALAGSPRVILADEPTASLDTDNALGVMELLGQLTAQEGLATAVVTHDVRLFAYADRVLSLSGGRLREGPHG